MSTQKRGILYVLLSGVIFGCMPLMAKWIYAGGGNAMSLVFFRSFFALPTLYLLMRRQGGGAHADPKAKISGKELKQVTLLVTLGLALTPMLLYSSYNYIASGVATTLHFSYPVFVLLGCLICFREKIGLVKALCVALCTLGIASLCDISGGMKPMGLFLAFASGISYAFYIIYLDKSGLKSMPCYKLGFYTSLVTSILLFLYTAVTKGLTLHMVWWAWILTVVFANLITVGAVILFQVGVAKIGPQSTAILSTSEPLTSILTGVLFLGEPFGMKTGIGASMILLSVTMLTIFEGQSEKQGV